MSLQIWLPLNGNLDNLGLRGDVLPVATGTTIVSAGKIGSCYHFGTTTSYITIPKETMTSFTTEASVCFWFKIISWNTSYATFFQAGLGSNPWAHYIFGFLRNSTSSTCCFTISNGSSASQASYVTPTFDLDRWYHIALVYKTGHCLIYIDGELYKDYITSIVPNFSGITTITTGISNNKSSYQTNCQMNDLRIYDHALSAKEVKEIARGLVLHYKLDDRFIESTTNLITSITAGGQTTVSDDIVTTSGLNKDTYFTLNLSESISENTQYTISCYAEMPPDTTWTFPIGGQTNTTLSWVLKPGYNSYSFIANNFSFGTKRLFMDDLNGTARTSLKQCKFYAFQLEKKDHATGYAGLGGVRIRGTGTVYDSSGYAHNAVSVGTIITTSPSPRYGTATKLNCSDPTTNSRTGLTYLQSNFGLTEPLQMTVCWWGRPESGYGGTSNHAAWCTSVSAIGPSDYDSTAFHHRDAHFDICLNSAFTPSNLAFNNYTLNEWHFYCVVYDGQNAILYKDGVETNRTSISNTDAPLKTFTNLYIGYSLAGGVWRKTLGSYADFRIYVTALTPAALQELYHTSATVDAAGNVYAREVVEI